MLSNRQATFNVLHRMPDGYIFTGADLAKQVKSLTGKQAYIATSLRHMREYKELYGREVANVNKSKSIYKMIGY